MNLKEAAILSVVLDLAGSQGASQDPFDCCDPASWIGGRKPEAADTTPKSTHSNKNSRPRAMSSHNSDSDSDAPEAVNQSAAKGLVTQRERAVQDFRAE